MYIYIYYFAWINLFLEYLRLQYFPVFCWFNSPSSSNKGWTSIDYSQANIFWGITCLRSQKFVHVLINAYIKCFYLFIILCFFFRHRDITLKALVLVRSPKLGSGMVDIDWKGAKFKYRCHILQVQCLHIQYNNSTRDNLW